MWPEKSEKTMSKLRCKIFDLYSDLGWARRLQVYQRWVGAPYVKTERFVPRQGLIYDLGCGLGILSHLLTLTSHKRTVIGVDFEKERLRLARKTGTPDESLSFQFGNLKNLFLRKCKGIILFDVLHHISYNFHKKVLNECYRALEKGGVLLIIDADERPFWKYVIWRLFELVAIRSNITKGDCLNLRPKGELRNMLEKIGFQTTVLSFHKGRFFPHILYLCRKV